MTELRVSRPCCGVLQEERNLHRWLGKMESDKLKREHWRKSSQWCAPQHALCTRWQHPPQESLALPV